MFVKTHRNCIFHKLGLCKKHEIYSKEHCPQWTAKVANCNMCAHKDNCDRDSKASPGMNICKEYIHHRKAKKNKAEKRVGGLEKNRLRGFIEQKIKEPKKYSKKVKRKELDVPLGKKEFDSDDKEDSSSDLFSPVNLVEDIIKSNFDPRAFELVDESDIPWADNEVKFITEPEFLGVTLFPRQLYVALEFFSAYCPYCSNKRFIREKIEVDTPLDEIMDRVVLYSNGVCPKCKTSRFEACDKGDHKFYNQLIGVVGQRGGKSALCGLLSAAILHKYLSMPNPSDYFRLLSNTTFHATFVALTFGQAYDLLWQPLYDLITGTKWFTEYTRFLESEGDRIGKELIKVRDTFIVFHNKNIVAYPSGPDKRKLRGKTRIISSIDELGWFFGNEDAIKYDPDAVYDALDNSLMTVLSASRKLFPLYPDTPSAYGLYISSPSSKTDKAMRLYKQSVNSPNIFGFNYPTWEFNPNISRNDLDDKYRADPVGAERDFGANPPHSSAPFISSPASLVPMFSDRKVNILRQVGHKLVKDSLGGKLMSPRMQILKKHSFPSVLTIDCGYNNNSFACMLKHREEDSIVVSGMIEIVPEDYPISFPDTYEFVIQPILTNFNVKVVAFDRWQSINLAQQIVKEHNIDSIRYSVTYKDFETCRTRLLSHEFNFPKLEKDVDDLVALIQDIESLIYNSPVAHLFLQCLMSKDTTRSIMKGDNFTDDLLRCLVLGASVLYSEEYEPLFTGEGDYDKHRFGRVSDFCAVGLKSVGISSSVKESNMGALGSKTGAGSGGGGSTRLGAVGGVRR